MYSNLTVPFHLSSNSKVFEYLQQSNTTLRPSSLSTDFLSEKASLHPYSRPTRTRCDSDEDSLGRSDSSTSFTEELDFDLAFDTETDSTTGDFDELVRQSSEDTLCSPESDSLCAGIRSKSLSIVPWNDKSSHLSKKAVRFADTLGLDLESIRYMTPPEPLISEFRLSQTPPTPTILGRRPAMSKYNLVSRNFTSPTNIVPLIYDQQILLECLYTKDATAYGTIRVHNLAFEKHVFVRVTEDEWTSYSDIQAWHSMNHAYDNTDGFTFQICLGRSCEESQGPKRVIFAVCLKAMSQQYWDNNQNSNYVLDVLERR